VRVLTVNAGSTSVKVVEVDGGVATTSHDSLDAALGTSAPDAVAHRVVHGGDRTAAARVDDALLAELRALTELAPLHQPPALDAIDRCRAAWPDVAQIACFDTTFHTTIPPEASTYALPARLRARVRVHGFHGLSHAWASRTAGSHVPGARRIVVAHLGGGESLCGVLDGESVITTMGFTPLDGLVMATRSGAVDPGALLWLAEHTDEDLGRVLEQESGLLGLCGSSDLQEVQARADAGDDDAALAVAVWRHRAVTLLAGCVAALGGLDVLVFTGGIGEHQPPARRHLADGLAWLGVAIDDHEPGDPSADAWEITAPGAPVHTFVVPAREDLQLAAEATALLLPPFSDR
jgi:acetate kinase